MIKAVILDCFGVLYLERQPGSSKPLTESGNTELSDLVHEGEYGLIDGQTLHKGIAQLMHRDLDEVEHSIAQRYIRNEPLMTYAQSLRPQHKLGMISNIGSDTIQQFFTPQERTEFFDAAIVSSEVGMVKPHPEIFEYACEQLGVDVSEAIMIDDVSANCEGARAAGLHAIQFISTDQAIRECGQILREAV